LKPGALDKAIELIKAEEKRVGRQGTICTAYFGPFDKIILDVEFESAAECEKFWDEWFADPEAIKWLEQWQTLVEAGGSNELWLVH
jgi:hypothetical protein